MKQQFSGFPPPELTKHSSLETYSLLYYVYTDLLLSQLWLKLKIYCLPSNRSIIQGTSPQNYKIFYVYPCSLEECVSVKSLCELYDEIRSVIGKNEQTLLLGIVSPDSTIVYYKMSDGLLKPRKNDED
ncbi:hypothetical protein PCANB_001796 [Pneumocystis canis]|nr:hypothetical protein PCK1_002216 [Pneumocystis canis]KAG5440226.1 hypothetical protein PCANB_001796 [Pneumocystis canis]